MSFGAIISDRLALPARGPRSQTDTLFLACKTAAGPTDKATECRSILDFEAVYGPRTGLTVAAWDYVDAAFREGLKRVYIGRYVTNYTDGLNLFLPTLGSGQLAIIGVPMTAAVYADMQTHCMYQVGPSMNNRVALRDVNSGMSVAQIEALADSAPTNDSWGATFGPWAIIPGPAGVYGAGDRLVPASAIVAGLIARVDKNGNSNRAAAGEDYLLQYAKGFEMEVSDVDRAGLFAHGVNMFGTVQGVLQMYGFQTNIAQSNDNPFWQFNCSRARMFLKARAQVRAQRYMFKTIDGQGKLAGQLKTDIAEEFFAVWNVDGLFGGTPQEAYYIEVGEVINTIDEIAQGHLHAVAQARLSLHTKAVMVDLVEVPVTSSVG